MEKRIYLCDEIFLHEINKAEMRGRIEVEKKRLTRSRLDFFVSLRLLFFNLNFQLILSRDRHQGLGLGIINETIYFSDGSS